MTSIVDIEGIGPVYGEKLTAAGVSTVEKLLEVAATPAGRADLAGQTGISADLILRWVNHADLRRIDGVGSEYSDLLEAAGVDSVVELAQRNPANLATALATTNEQRKLVRALPADDEVARWVSQAKGLDRAVHHEGAT
jgi:predicted flap endonuclease-1-like 5' DNA nuclease